MAFSPSKWWSNVTSSAFRHYGENPGKMLLHTGAIGWVLSSAAQIVGIIANKQLSPEQKMFLIPQECADAGINIVSFYTLTSGVKFIGSKLTKTAKLRTPAIDKLLKERGLVLEKGMTREHGKVYAGDWDFDITKLKHYRFNIAPEFKPFNNGAEVITGLIGSIISSNIVTPYLRNAYASIRQKDMINQYKGMKKDPKALAERPKLETFTSNPYSTAYPFNGNLKI